VVRRMTYAAVPPATTTAPAPPSTQGSELGAGLRIGGVDVFLRISVTLSIVTGEAILVTAASVWAGLSARICMLAGTVDVAAVTSTTRQLYAARRNAENPRAGSVTWTLRP